MLHQVNGDVVELHGVGQGDHASAFYLQLVRLIVVDPVCDVFDALLSEDIGRVESLGEARPHPAAGRAAAELSDDLDGLADGSPFVGFLVENLLDVAVAQQLPLPVEAGLH